MHEKGLTKCIILYRKYTTSWKKDRGRSERREGETGQLQGWEVVYGREQIHPKTVLGRIWTVW